MKNLCFPPIETAAQFADREEFGGTYFVYASYLTLTRICTRGSEFPHESVCPAPSADEIIQALPNQVEECPLWIGYKGGTFEAYYAKRKTGKHLGQGELSLTGVGSTILEAVSELALKLFQYQDDPTSEAEIP